MNAITGCTDFRICRIDGDQDGKGLPTCIVIEKGEDVARYVPESTPSSVQADDRAIKSISCIALRALADFDRNKISMEHAAAIIANETVRHLSRKHIQVPGIVAEMEKLMDKWRAKDEPWNAATSSNDLLTQLADKLELSYKHSGWRPPEGFVLVPREPSDEQLLRMFRAFHSDKPEVLEQVMGMSDLSDHQAQLLQDGYCEAIAAAPSGEKL